MKKNKGPTLTQASWLWCAVQGTEQIAEAAGKRSWADVQQDAPLFRTEAAVAVEQAVQDASAQDTAREPAQEAATVPEVSVSHAAHHVEQLLAHCLI